ncbi:MAG: RNA polymerase, sigma-24 subunit, ECF subfamily [Candidatus Nomurabacteria bacterium GW2011_GWF2_40_12]|uniref:RNA polymerase, sigma-24 subunit, ECF subfamily n=1 Tax=Candidatus Nomurabacteria bacterium GW2011_GWF2_40_12 TaxID=1618776 RepID=A0A0G0QQ15_9BACT|nr:MAG: RNA polymerase, sigma-24 subunit, ECF subfamily [Candidatus Nomurabacteria bacterium GW2011_GWF2_40_12]
MGVYLFEKSDNEIIELYKNGEKEALKYLIERYASPIFNFVAHLTNRNDAPDIVQDIFIKTWKNIKRYDSKKASFKTWIFTIARNSVTDFWRKKKNILFTEIEESFSENIPDENLLPDEVLQKLEDAELLNKTLEKLRPDYREVLVLYYQEEMTFEEIGGILSKPTNTVKSQHRRAIIELRELLHF